MTQRRQLFFRDSPADAEAGEVMLALPPGDYGLRPGPGGNSVLVVRRAGSSNNGKLDQPALLPLPTGSNGSGNSQDAAPVLPSTAASMRQRQAGADDDCAKAAKELAHTGDATGRPMRHSVDAIAEGVNAARQARSTADKLKSINDANKARYRLPRQP